MPRLLQFKAGRCVRRGETNQVDCLPAKGLLYLENAEDDGLCHLRFKDLESDAVVDDLILFSGDATFANVPHPTQSPSRVYVLKFSSSDQRLLFWMQSVDPSSDARNARRLNELIEDPSSAEGQADDGDAMAVDPEPEQPAPIEQPPTTEGSTSGPAAEANQQFSSQLQDFLANFTANRQAQSQPSSAGYSLVDILTPSALLPLLHSPSPSLVATLTPFLPVDVPPTADSLRRVVESIEFRRAVGSFDRALRTGALGSFVGALGLPSEAALGVENYVEEVKKKHPREGGDDMQTD